MYAYVYADIAVILLSPHGNISGNSNSLDSDISLLSIAADMSFAVFIDEIAQLCSAAHAPQEKRLALLAAEHHYRRRLCRRGRA